MLFKHLLRVLPIVLALALLAACGAAPAAEPARELALTVPTQNAEAPDDNSRVFYEIFVGSFSDSDGDGTGDLRGIIDRLDYLNDGDPDSGLSLGVEGIWLTPIFQSRSYHKYNVADYYAIDEKFGTMEDLDALIAACHERGIKLILDLVINHTDLMHEWFSAFTKAHRNGDTSDPYYDYYCYYHRGETAPAGRSFSQLSGTDDFYECNFSGDMPELNFDNPAVRQGVLDIARFYLERGVDGFRFDAAKYVYFGDNPRSAEFWEWYMDELRAIKPDGFYIAEVWDGDGVTEQYYFAMDCFNFTVSQSSGVIAEAAKGGKASRYTGYVESYLNEIQTLRADALYAPFLTNHDMDRAAGFLNAEKGELQMAANLYLLGPGAPFIYYGEELGMRGSRGGANTDANRRLKMVWGDDDTVADPSGTTYSADNRAAQTAAEAMLDENSIYNYYKTVLMIRRANPEIARGTYQSLAIDQGKLGGFTSTWNGNTVCVLHNPSRSAETVDVSKLGSFTTLAAVAGNAEAALDGTTLTIPGQTSVVLR